MVGAIIQARMTSSRFPGKTLKLLAGKPLLWHVIQRLKASQVVQKIVVATTKDPQDDAIEKFCIENQILYYRGSREDVLSRFIEAAQVHQIEIILRVCADSPLIDFISIDKMFELLKKENADLVSVLPETTRLLDGIEWTTLSFLKKIQSLVFSDYQKEHVTLLAKERPEIGKVVYYTPEEELCFTDIRITVDHEKDFEFMKAVYDRLYKPDKLIDIRELHMLPFYLFRINRGIEQKPPQLTYSSLVLIGKKDKTHFLFQRILEDRLSIPVKVKDWEEYSRGEKDPSSLYLKILE